jgi:amidophosphoribosyltransferase
MSNEIKTLQEQLWTGSYYNEGMGSRDGLSDKLGEECGVFGVFGHSEAASLSYYGLHALQHRGQESSGICVADGSGFKHHRGMGLVKDVFTNEILAGLGGSSSIAHVRYSTAGESKLANAVAETWRLPRTVI